MASRRAHDTKILSGHISLQNEDVKSCFYMGVGPGGYFLLRTHTLFRSFDFASAGGKSEPGRRGEGIPLRPKECRRVWFKVGEERGSHAYTYTHTHTRTTLRDSPLLVSFEASGSNVASLPPLPIRATDIRLEVYIRFFLAALCAVSFPYSAPEPRPLPNLHIGGY